MIRIRPEWYSSSTNKKLHVVLDDTCFMKWFIPAVSLSCLQAPAEMQDIDTQKQKKEEKHSWNPREDGSWMSNALCTITKSA